MSLPPQHALEVLPGVAGLDLGPVLGGAGGHDLAAAGLVGYSARRGRNLSAKGGRSRVMVFQRESRSIFR